jgi:hypothetical protein
MSCLCLLAEDNARRWTSGPQSPVLLATTDNLCCGQYADLRCLFQTLQIQHLSTQHLSSFENVQIVALELEN